MRSSGAFLAGVFLASLPFYLWGGLLWPMALPNGMPVTALMVMVPAGLPWSCRGIGRRCRPGVKSDMLVRSQDGQGRAARLAFGPDKAGKLVQMRVPAEIWR